MILEQKALSYGGMNRRQCTLLGRMGNLIIGVVLLIVCIFHLVIQVTNGMIKNVTM